MAKIDNINELNPSFSLPQAKEVKNTGTSSFENVLNSAIDKKPAVSTTQENKAGGLNEIMSPLPGMQKPADIVSGKTDNLIQLLESFSSQLQDPGVSLKNIAPVMEDIKDTASNLLAETGQLSPSDTSLKTIATQTAVTAQTEYLKFQRGDYLP